MRARKVPAGMLPDVAGDWVDRSRRPYVENGTAWVPVKDGYPADLEIPERCGYAGRGFQMIGDIAVFHGRRPDTAAVAEVISLRKPAGVLWLKGLSGIERTPEVEILSGSSRDVMHRENGVTYWLDPAKVMFSMGNRLEKERVAGLVVPGERAADMCAGIGYFAIPLALAGAEVHAMEINPVAYGYLVRNTGANRVAGRVTPACGDSRALLSGTYDRIVIGHFDGPGLLVPALRHVSAGSVIHVHSAGAEPPDIRPACDAAGYRVSVAARKVKSYAPHAWHYVQDVIIL